MSFYIFLRSQHRLYVSTLLAFLLFAPATRTAESQDSDDTPITVPTHNPEAVAAINKAIAALGGESAASALKDSMTTADCTRQSHGKTENHKLRWITKEDFSRIDSGSSDENPTINGPDGRTVSINGKIVPVSERSGRIFRPFHIPLMMLWADMATAKTKIELLPNETIDGRTVTHVRITDINASEYSAEPINDEWFFDSTSNLPIRVAFPVQGVGSRRLFIGATIDYSDFNADPQTGVMIPFTFRRSFDGGLVTTCRLSSFASNQSPAEQTFTRGGGNR